MTLLYPYYSYAFDTTLENKDYIKLLVQNGIMNKTHKQLYDDYIKYYLEGEKQEL